MARSPAAQAIAKVDESHVIAATFNDQMAVGMLMIAVCVIIHGIGLFGLQRALHTKAMGERIDKLSPLSIRGALFTLMIMFALIGLHFLEIWLFAFLYDLVGAMRDFPDALYFSTITYATLGYSDTGMHEHWRMVAALEGIMGVILLGWSTAFLLRIMQRLEGSQKQGIL